MKRLVLIDSHAIIHRAFHALPRLTSPKGELVNAVYGFASILVKMLKDLKPDYVVATFDHTGPTFRHVAFERYKATRVKAPDELYQQIPMVKQVLAAFGIPVLERQGYEADDIIGTVTRLVRSKHPDVDVVIATGDLDTLQLIDDRTKVYTMRKGVSDTALYDAAMVRGRYGLLPKQMIDYKGLRGDPSDNIPGVRGIGEKTASELLKAYGSVEEIYRRLKKNSISAKPGIITALKTYEADALFSKTLATIDVHVPVKFILASARMRKGASREQIRSVFIEFGFQSLLRRIGDVVPEHIQGQALLPIGGSAPALQYRSGDAFPQSSGHVVLLPPSPDGVVYFAFSKSQVIAVQGSEVGSVLDAVAKRGDVVFVFDAKPLIRAELLGKDAMVRDLMIMWWLLDPGRRAYRPEMLVEREAKLNVTAPHEIVSYLFEIAPQLEARLKSEELESVYQELEAPLTAILVKMETRGIGFDASPLLKLSKEMGDAIAILESKIYGAAGGEFNINSPRQLGEVLFEKLGVSSAGIRKTEKSGVLSTRETELVKLRSLHPVIGDILLYRELAKLKSTYVDTLPKLVAHDGRIHTLWNQTGTATGRLSSQNPNLQNIPIRGKYGKEIRTAFVASRGYTLVAFDYSQLELRIAADLADDEKMIAAFRRGIDIHRLTASEVNNVPIDAVTPELRFKAKALNFGVLYGMGARAFAESAGVTRDEAELFIEEYFRDFRGIARYIEATKEFARANGYTKTVFGRKRFFPDILATNFRMQREAERMAVNHPIQGTEADIMKKAMIEIDRAVTVGGNDGDVRLLLQIHDELFFEIKKTALKRAEAVIKNIMESVWKGKVPMRVEIKKGATWGALE